MTTIAITPQLKVSMLKHLVNGKDLDFVATVTRVPRDTVLDIVSKHGYPNTARMSWGIDVLVKNGDKIPDGPLRSGTPLAPATPAARVGNSATGVNGSSGFAVTAPSAVILPALSAAGEILQRAAQSPFIRTQNLGRKIHDLLDDLTLRLRDETDAAEAKVKADKEAAAIATRIAQLEAEIAKLKRKTPKVAKTTGVSHATRPVVTGEFSCTMDSCDRTFDTSQGVALHQRRAHEGFNPRTVNAA